MIWHLFRKKTRTNKQTEQELRKAATGREAERDRQPRNREQVNRDPETDPAKPTDN